MRLVERLAVSLRHSPYLRGADLIWNVARPVYNQLVSIVGRNGLERVINGTDRMLLLPRYRGVGEDYEPEVWQRLMADIRPGDTFLDVGTFIGLYTVAVAQRVGAGGRVVAFEPDPVNYAAAKAHVELNRLAGRVDLIQAAVGARSGRVAFCFGGDVGHAAGDSDSGASTVRCVTVDEVLPDRALNVMKIDVEGYEEMVLNGAECVLSDIGRSPRAIYIEVHPYAWSAVGTTSESLLKGLSRRGYRAFGMDGRPVDRIETYGEIVARREHA